jgi:hypothetical protein
LGNGRSMRDLKVESFITGNAALFDVVCRHPELRMVPIEHVDTVRSGLRQREYNFRIRYRGPHRPQHDTLKQNAQAFTVYIYNNII